MELSAEELQKIAWKALSCGAAACLFLLLNRLPTCFTSLNLAQPCSLRIRSSARSWPCPFYCSFSCLCRKLWILQRCCKYPSYLCKQGQMLCCQLGAARPHAAGGGASCGSPQSLGAGRSPHCGDTSSFVLEDVLVIKSHLKLLENSIQCSLDFLLHARTSGYNCDLAGGRAIKHCKPRGGAVRVPSLP